MTDEVGTAEVLLLGSPEIRRDGAAIRVDTRKAIALLAYLAVSGVTVSRDILSYIFWPESSQTRARSALRRTLSSLRTAVGGAAVAADRESVRLITGEVHIDVVRFATLVAAGAVEELRLAAGLYRGDFLAGFTVRGSAEFEDWQRAESERFRRDADAVLTALVEDAAARGEHGTAIELAERRLDLDRLNEPAHRMLLTAEAWAGRRSRAIDRYRDAVRILEDELGVAPLPETTAVYEAIRKGQIPDLPRGRVEPARIAARARTPRPAEVPFAGRAAELATLIDDFRNAMHGGRMTVIEGEAGIGKTRLTRELISRVEVEGGGYAETRCHEGEIELPYAPLTELLRELVARSPTKVALNASSRRAVGALLPELAPAGPSSPPGEGPAAQARFFDSLRSAITEMAVAADGLVLVLDDLHLADHATAEFVAYLARRIAEAPVLLVATWRADEVDRTGPFPKLINALLRTGTGRIIRLARLEDREVEELITGGEAPRLDSPTRLAIARHSEGVPLIAVEYARAARDGGDFDESVPEPVRSLLESRLLRVSGVSGQVLAAAAVLGRAFSSDLMRAVSGRRDHEVADGLDDLEAMELIGRGSAGLSTSYDFAHDKLRQVAYDRLGAGRRILLHSRAAAALSSSKRLSAAQAGAAAHHAEAAGDPQRAAELYATAAKLARSIYANSEATEYFSAALTLGHAEPQAIREALGDLAVLSGDYRRARGEFETAAALVEASDLSRIEHKLGRLYYRRGDWAAADSYLQAALDQNGSDVLLVEILADLATNAHRSGNSVSAREIAGEALALADALGDPRAGSRAANVSGLLARAAGDLANGVALLQRSRELAAEAKDEEMQVAALNNLARTHAELGDHAEARVLLEGAVAQCRALGDRHREAALLSNLGDAQFALGALEESALSVRRSAAIMAEIGIEGEDLIPEVWKLTEW